MRRKVLYSFFVLIGLFSAGTVSVDLFETKIEKAAVRYGHDRPFSFYYPYNYQFYYQNPHSYGSSNSCHWHYTNGTYVYYCG